MNYIQIRKVEIRKKKDQKEILKIREKGILNKLKLIELKMKKKIIKLCEKIKFKYILYYLNIII